MYKATLKRLFITTIIASLVASAAVGITVLLVGSFDSTDWKVLGTTLAVGIFSITSLANLRNLDSSFSSYRLFALTSIVVSVIAFGLIAYLIWGSPGEDYPWKLTFSLSVLAISSAHASLLLPLRARGNTQAILVTATLAFIALVAAMIIYLIWAADSDLGDFYYRLLGVFAILDVLGTIVSPIVSRFAAQPASKS